MRSRHAFTLVELLTVIAIIGVLAAILVPVAGTVRGKARAAQCLSNLRQVGVATWAYINENSGRLPSNRHAGQDLSWIDTLEPYLAPDFIGRCPAREDHPHPVTYAWNDLLASPAGQGLAYGSCRMPSATVMLLESPDNYTADHIHFRGAARGVTPAFFRANVRVDAHGTSSNYLFVDGHVASLPWTEASRRLAGSNPVFVHP